MALAPTLYDFQIALSNVDRGVEQQLSFKVARHPSETMERVWIRVLAYGWRWQERLAFGPGLSDPEAPDLEERDYTNQVVQWIRVGKADPIKVQRAVDQNPLAKVAVLFESPARLEAFLTDARAQGAARVARAELAALDEELVRELGTRDARRTKLAVTFVGDHFYIDVEGDTLEGPLSRGTL